MIRGLLTQASLFVAFLRQNALRIAVDLVIVVSWMIVSTQVLHSFGVVRWVQYVVLFAGVIAYALVTPPWSGPTEEEPT